LASRTEREAAIAKSHLAIAVPDISAKNAQFTVETTMQTFSPGRGRKKAVNRFTAKHGACMLAMLTAIAAIILLLYIFGFLHLDAD
jgi:hypothetical protein